MKTFLIFSYYKAAFVSWKIKVFKQKLQEFQCTHQIELIIIQRIADFVLGGGDSI